MARKQIDPKTRSRGISFAKRLKAEREKLSMSQSELSLQTGIPLDTIRSIELGRIVSPGVFVAADLVQALSGDLERWVHESGIKALEGKGGRSSKV